MKIEKILLVAPEPGKLGNHRPRIRLAKTLFPPLGLMMVAALTPPQCEVKLIDEAVEMLNFNEPADLVGLTANTASVNRAYEIAAAFRRRGTTVVMGGIHATALPKEALKHVDIVVRGEAEGPWPQVLADLEQGNPKSLYEHSEFPSLKNIPWVNRNLIRSESYLLPNTIQTSRGCIHDCAFCSVPQFFGGKYRMRDVADVINELRQMHLSSSSSIIFVDDNIFARKDRARGLMRHLEPMGFEWFGQASMDTLQDDEFLAQAGASGCRVLFVGLESLSSENLQDANKPFNKPEMMKETVERLNRHHIAMLGAFIVGLPGDDLGVVEKVVNFVQYARIPLVQIAILIPLPGTELGKALEPAIFDPDYAKRDGSRLVFRHPIITPPRLLEEQLQWAYRTIYSRQAVNERLRGVRGPHLKIIHQVIRGYRIRTNKWLARLGAQGLKI